MEFRRRGGRKVIVAPDGHALSAATSRFNLDNVLVKALARARWSKLLDNGTFTPLRKSLLKSESTPPMLPMFFDLPYWLRT